MVETSSEDQEMAAFRESILKRHSGRVGLGAYGYGMSGADNAAKEDSLGGIDLNGDRLNIKVDGQGMPLPLQFQDKGLIEIEGLSPVIRQIIPAAATVIPLLNELSAR
jgi:hypothetical protein